MSGAEYFCVLQKLEAPVREEFPEGMQVGPDVKDRQTLVSSRPSFLNNTCHASLYAVIDRYFTLQNSCFSRDEELSLMLLQADDIFKSDAANPDRQILNSDVGFLEMMRFKGAAQLHVQFLHSLPQIVSRCSNVPLQQSMQVFLGKMHCMSAVRC